MFHRFFLSGNVQGVGFRAYVKNKALALGLKGFVRNLNNGVEIVIDDPDFAEKLTDLPYLASIKNIAKSRYEGKESFYDFKIQRS